MGETMNTVILKICRQQDKNSYRKYSDVENVINYVLQDNKRKKDDIWNSISTYSESKEGIIKDFHKLKRLYDKTDGLQLKHLVLSWKTRPNICRKKLRKLIKHTMSFWGNDYQVVYAVHENNPDNWHMHIVLNSVSNSGYKIQITQQTIKKFKRKFNNIWSPYGYELCMEQQNQKAVEGKSFECSK